jgi:hypothetical protein
MNDRDQFARLSKLQESDDNEECWKEFYTEDIVRRITGLEPLVGRDESKKIGIAEEGRAISGVPFDSSSIHPWPSLILVDGNQKRAACRIKSNIYD